VNERKFGKRINPPIVTEPKESEKIDDSVPEAFRAAWIQKGLRSIEQYQQLSQQALDEGDGEKFGSLHDRMAWVFGVVFAGNDHVRAAMNSALGKAEEGGFTREGFYQNLSVDEVEAFTKGLGAEAEKGDIRINETIIAEIHDDRMELHVPPVNGKPLELFRGFIHGLEQAAVIAEARGIKTVEMTSWLIGKFDQERVGTNGVLTEDISEEKMQAAQALGTLYNPKNLDSYLTKGELPPVKKLTCTPSELAGFARQFSR
jgi:hypothetical protein